MGRGTTLIESALRNRIPIGNDINQLSKILVQPRLNPPSISEIRDRLSRIDLSKDTDVLDNLLVFYHPDTLREITNIRSYFLGMETKNDHIDKWIRMVVTNRLTGHSSGFLSVYTLPPNQAVTIESQRKINEKRSQLPPYRNLKDIVIRKSKQLLRNLTYDDIHHLRIGSKLSEIYTGHADNTPDIPDKVVNLVVTSPPFLDVVDYQTDNWLRC